MNRSDATIRVRKVFLFSPVSHRRLGMVDALSGYDPVTTTPVIVKERKRWTKKASE